MGDYWKDNGIEKPQSIVVCAACRMDGVIYLGARHWDNPMRAMYIYANREAVTGKAKTIMREDEQGFINQFGEFLTRVEALAVVKASGQPFNPERNGSTTELFSEGLY